MTPALRRGLEAAAGLLAVGAAVAWLSGAFAERVPARAVDVRGPEVAEGRTAVVREVTEPAFEWASGEVASARQTAISSRVLARIEAVPVRAGSAVSAGDVLVVLDARDLRARAGEAEEALRSAEARLDLAQRELARTEELVRTGVAPERRLDEARSALRAARAEVAGRREALDEARTAASFAEIRSPVDGRVVDRLAEPGDTAVPGRPLLRVDDPTLLRVEAPVRESLAVQLAVGDRLRVDVPALPGAVDGRIDEIVPFADPGARTLLVKVSLPRTHARLFAGMFARVAIPAGERRRLLVPEASVERVGQLEFATVVGEDGAAERRLVTTGTAAGGGRIEVLSGLRAGERVKVSRSATPGRGDAAAGASPGAGEDPAAASPDGADDPAAASPDGSDDPAAAAAEAIAQLRESLGRALREALAQGPRQAIDTCRIEAPRLAAAVSRPGLSVGRTSHRLRNPANAPADWMLPLLEAYREAPPRPGSHRTVDLGSGRTGYVEPIYLQPLCATCHGRNVDPDLLADIRAAYPDDEAVGFEPGELRGLFWAVVATGSP